MSAAIETAKIMRQNISMLRKKSFFRDVVQPRSIKKRSVINPKNLKRKALIIANRKLRYRLTLSIIISLIAFLFLLGYTVFN